MKDKNGIEIKCWNCRLFTQGFCAAIEVCPECYKGGYFTPTAAALEASIAELQSKLTETVKLLSERSRECGKLQALLEIKNKSNTSTQSTDADDARKNGGNSTESVKVKKQNSST